VYVENSHRVRFSVFCNYLCALLDDLKLVERYNNLLPMETAVLRLLLLLRFTGGATCGSSRNIYFCCDQIN